MPFSQKRILTPVYKEVMGDLDTPVSVYLKLNQTYSFLLESVTGGENIARYSFIGFDPFCSVECRKTGATVTYDDEQVVTETGAIESVEKALKSFDIEESVDYPLDKLPRFIGGAVGFFSWEVISEIEKVHFSKDNLSPVPLAHFMFPSAMVIFDHVKRKIILLVLVKEGDIDGAKIRLDEIEAVLRSPLTKATVELSPEQIEAPFDHVSSNYDELDFKDHVLKAKKHIYEGDVFQLVLSQKFQLKSKKNPFDVYRKLRSLNPSPYMYFFNMDSYHIIGTSPEILVRLEDRKATLRPIAGTRPRLSGQEDALIRSLVEDEKEKAEHIMLVDLGRNDLGRVCQFNTVKTTSVMGIERYSHVLHMVSNVEGVLEEGKTCFDLLKATFPCGTVSGAPKIRAIEIIEQLEPDARGLYAGALGYIDFRGNMDLCITIRTILAYQESFYVQAGAGIVSDSIPENEYQETRSKARGMIEACL